MEIVTKLPEKKGVVGTKDIVKGAQNGRIKHVIVASNCPSFLVLRLNDLRIKVEKFEGDQSQLATKLGKAFPVAMIGFEE